MDEDSLWIIISTRRGLKVFSCRMNGGFWKPWCLDALIWVSTTIIIVEVSFGQDNIVTVAGNKTAGFSGDGGPATSASLFIPSAVFVDSLGNIYVADKGNNRIRKIDTSGIITTVAGNGEGNFSGDGGKATLASLNSPEDIFVDGSGNLYIADTGNHRVRKVNPSGIITTVAGNGKSESSGDGGAAINAGIRAPSGIFVDAMNTLYLVEPQEIQRGAQGIHIGLNFYIRKVDISGNISTIASIRLSNRGFGDPRSIFLDKMGNIYTLDRGNHQVYKIDSSGSVTIAAGDGFAEPFTHEGRFSGDGGSATKASLNFPSGVFVDGPGNLYIADSNNNRIRKVDTSGIMTTVVGNGKVGFSGDGGSPIEASLTYPSDVFVDRLGNLYIADTGNHRIRKVGDRRFVGKPTPDFNGDGKVGFDDFFLFAAAFGSNDITFDLDEDGKVDLNDFFLFAEAFGK